MRTILTADDVDVSTITCNPEVGMSHVLRHFKPSTPGIGREIVDINVRMHLNLGFRELSQASRLMIPLNQRNVDLKPKYSSAWTQYHIYGGKYDVVICYIEFRN